MSSEDLAIRKLKGAINALKNGTKKPEDTNAGALLKILKKTNEPMHDELFDEYSEALDIYRKKFGSSNNF